MSGPVFVLDAEGRALMPMAAAYARKLLQQGKAKWFPHHAFAVIQLSQVIVLPTLRPIVVGIRIYLHTAELIIVAAGQQEAFPLLHVIVDLRTDLTWRVRRRGEHRRRRRARGRYRRVRRYGLPFKLRRPSRFHDHQYRTSITAHRGHYMRRYIPATIHWRAQAIARTIAALQRLLPLSQAVVVSPTFPVNRDRQASAATLRQQLIEAYGTQQADRRFIPTCAYCGTTQGQIEAEHIVPRSRGGTDSWNNRVLACASCNARKRDRTPEEAGMRLRTQLKGEGGQANRAGAYSWQTARRLEPLLVNAGLAVRRYQDLMIQPEHALAVHEQTLLQLLQVPGELDVYVAKPIARPVKQVFSARNYNLGTSSRQGIVRIGSTVKRRVRVNQGVKVHLDGRRRVEVIPVGNTAPAEQTGFITQGMLCEARRAGQTMQGIVASIHSSGRLTLLVLDQAHTTNITWKRVVVSPRQNCRVLSNERIIFVRANGAT